MTQKLKELLERAEAWPQELQEEAVETLLSIEQGRTGAYQLTEEDIQALGRSAEDVRLGKFASEEAFAIFFEQNRA